MTDDFNDTLRYEGPEGVRDRLGGAKTFETDNGAADQQPKPGDPGAPPRPHALPFWTPADPTSLTKLWVTKNVIARGEVSSWIGPPKGGKSILVTDIAVHRASGIDWRGYRNKGGPCGAVYFALERAALTKRRITGYKQRGDLAETAPIAVVEKVIDLLDAQCVQTILDTLKAFEDHFGIEAALAMFDTFNKGIAAGGGDEDKARDQNKVAANMRRILEKANIHIAGVGHTGKDESRGERGSNARFADVDLQVTITGKEKEIRTATVTGANDQPEDELTRYVIKGWQIGCDEDGDPIWTSIVDRQEIPASAATKKRGRPKGSDRAKIALSALELAIAESGRIPPVSNHIPEGVRSINLELWEKYFDQRSVARSEKAKNSGRDFRWCVEKLQADGFIEKWGEEVWLI